MSHTWHSAPWAPSSHQPSLGAAVGVGGCLRIRSHGCLVGPGCLDEAVLAQAPLAQRDALALGGETKPSATPSLSPGMSPGATGLHPSGHRTKALPGRGFPIRRCQCLPGIPASPEGRVATTLPGGGHRGLINEAGWGAGSGEPSIAQLGEQSQAPSSRGLRAKQLPRKTLHGNGMPEVGTGGGGDLGPDPGSRGQPAAPGTHPAPGGMGRGTALGTTNNPRG